MKKIAPHLFVQLISYGVVTLFVGYIILLQNVNLSILIAYSLFLVSLFGIINFSEKLVKSRNWHFSISILFIAMLGTIAGWISLLLELQILCWITDSQFTAGLFEDEFYKAITYVFPVLFLGEIARKLPRWLFISLCLTTFTGLFIWFYQGIDRSEIPSTEVLKSDMDHPNIVLILADDLGFNDISLNGNSLIQTPHIDNIAKSGANFKRAYATAPVCSTSRAGMLTGRYQNRYGFEALPDPFPWVMRLRRADLEKAGNVQDPLPWYKTSRLNKRGLPASEQTLGEVLQKEGYATALIGKWHLGMHPNYRPKRHGFDYHFGFYNGASLYADIGDPKMEEARLNQYLDDFQWQQLTYDVRENGNKIEIEGNPYQTTLFGEKSAEFIEENKDNRFFLFASFNAPHAPIHAPKKYYDQLTHISDHNQRVYYAMIKCLDDAVGMIMGKLKELGLEENTIVYFTSDNGGATYTDLCDNAPFKGGKITNFEGGQVVPFAMKWEGTIDAGIVYDKPISLMDIYTTSVEEANALLPQNVKIDGKNLIPFLKDTISVNGPHDLIFARSIYAKFVRKGAFKLIINGRSGHSHLYNVEEDIGEQNDIYEQMPEKVEELKMELKNWEKELAPPLWETLAHIAVDVNGGTYYFPN